MVFCCVDRHAYSLLFVTLNLKKTLKTKSFPKFVANSFGSKI